MIDFFEANAYTSDTLSSCIQYLLLSLWSFSPHLTSGGCTVMQISKNRFTGENFEVAEGH